MRINMDQFRETFFAEAAEHLTALEACLLRVETEPGDPELLNTIFRAAHSIKGASGTFGFADVAKFTHTLESLFDRMREGTIAVTPQLTGTLLTACDVLGALIDAAKANAPPPPVAELILGELQHVLGATHGKRPDRPAVSEPPAQADALRSFRIVFAPGADVFRRGLDPLFVLRDLSELGQLTDVRADLSRLPALDALDPESCYLAWTVHLTTARPKPVVEGVFCFVADESLVQIEEVTAGPPPSDHKSPDAPAGGPEPGPVETPEAAFHSGVVAAPAARTPAGAPPAAKAPAGGGASGRGDRSSIRVPIDKIDKLVNLVEELVVTQSMLNQVVDQFTPDKLTGLREAVGAMERNLRDLQERVMAVRMMPISSITGRYPRVVRELAGVLGKKIRFEAHGEDTELDKQVIEQIGDPILHLIRNSADHGIDPPEERLRAGKPEEGVIRLTARQQGDCVFLEVADDGRGLDLDRIRSKAIAKGLIDPDAPHTDDEIRALIFHPGFSTAEKVSDVSGRGVGMDVVKKNIEALSGSVTITSERGRGTRVRIKLPLTLAILDGLCLGVGDDVFVVPLLSVVESLRPRRADVKSILGRGTVLMVRGDTLPLWPLSELMDRPGLTTDPAEGLVVIVEGDGRRYGLLVDELLGQTQVVIKTLETHYQKVEGITGATILGDGRVAMILDVNGLFRLVGGRALATASA